MSSTYYDAFAGLVSVFAAGLSPAIPVAFPNVHMEPPAAGFWLEVKWFPNETQNYGLANDGPSLERGFAQVMVCQRLGSGIVGGLAIADAVVAAFPKGTAFGAASVQRKPWISAVLTLEAKVAYPITINWQRFASTTA